jgi:integrase
MTLKEFFMTVYRPKRLRGKSPETTRLYLISINHFSCTMGHEATIADLTDDNLNLHCQRVKDLGKAAATINKDISQITTIWRFAHRLNRTKLWPTVLKETEPERVPQAWMPDEANALIESISRNKSVVGSIPGSLFWMAFVRLGIDTGERVSAIRSTEWLWLSGQWLAIPAEARKGKTRDRMYKLNPDTVQVLDQIRSISTSKVILPWPYCYHYFWRKYSDVLKEAGLPTGRRCGPHRLRRTHASAVHAAGGNAQEAMDHADQRTTKAYLDPRLSRGINAAEIMSSYLKKPKP